MKFIVNEFGLPLGDNSIEDIHSDTKRSLGILCEASADTWEDTPELREDIVGHLIHDHRLLNHPQGQQVVTVLELDHLVRQLRGKEAQVDVIYQRQEYQPD